MRKIRKSNERVDEATVWLSIILTSILIAAIWRTFVQDRNIAIMDDIYFQFNTNTNGQIETIFYQYNVKTDSVDEIGIVAGNLQNCKIDSERKFMIGVKSPSFVSNAGSDKQLGIVKYILGNGSSQLLLSEEQMQSFDTKEIKWSETFPYDKGEKICISYYGNNIALYNIKTGTVQKVCIPDKGRIYDIRDNVIWYCADNKLMMYNFKTQETIWQTKVWTQCSISDNGRKAVLNDNKRIYLYDTMYKIKRCILYAGWNKGFGGLSAYSYGWDKSGDYFYYIEHFNKLFSSSDVRIKVYNLHTKETKSIYFQRNVLSSSSYAFIRNMDGEADCFH